MGTGRSLGDAAALGARPTSHRMKFRNKSAKAILIFTGTAARRMLKLARTHYRFARTPGVRSEISVAGTSMPTGRLRKKSRSVAPRKISRCVLSAGQSSKKASQPERQSWKQRKALPRRSGRCAGFAGWCLCPCRNQLISIIIPAVYDWRNLSLRDERQDRGRGSGKCANLTACKACTK